jgi:hypothetical protein
MGTIVACDTERVEEESAAVVMVAPGMPPIDSGKALVQMT